VRGRPVSPSPSPSPSPPLSLSLSRALTHAHTNTQEAAAGEKPLPLDGALPSARALAKRFAPLDEPGAPEARSAWRRLLAAAAALLVDHLAAPPAGVAAPRGHLGLLPEAAPPAAAAHDAVVRRVFLALAGSAAAPRTLGTQLERLLGTHARGGMQSFLAGLWRGVPAPSGARPGLWPRVHALYIAAALWEGAAARSDAPAARARLLEEEAAELVPLLLATLAEPHRALRHAALTVPAAPPPRPPVRALLRFDACRAGRVGEGL
jgi:hypothetical protein